MAWTTALTAVSNAALTAAQWNASVRDNLAETAAAKASTAGQIFVATGLNALAARTPTSGLDTTAGTTTSATFTNTLTGAAATGPAITVTTGAKALVAISAVIQNATGSAETDCGFAVTGASTIAAHDEASIRFTPYTANARCRAAIIDMPALTPGSNTFEMQYKATSGTATFDDRSIIVIPF